MIVLESSLLSVAGGVLGTLLALLMTFFLSRAPATAGLVSSHVAPAVMAQGIGIAVLIGILGAVSRVSRRSPAADGRPAWARLNAPPESSPHESHEDEHESERRRRENV